MKKMEFQKSEFKRGLNTTVRLGEKWRGLDIGEIIEIEEGKTAEIIWVAVHRLKDTSRQTLIHEHDRKCRTYEGLIDTLKNIYPELNEQNMGYAIVTSVAFRPLPRG